MITNVYVDGFNLYYGCLRGRPGKWLDLERLFAQLLPGHDINRIRYFTARVSDRVTDPGVAGRQHTYLRALGTLPSVEVHLGHFMVKETRMPLADPPPPPAAQTVAVLRTEEKGSDVNLATYLVHDAHRDDANIFVVVSNDSDLTEPLRIVRHELGKTIGLLNPHKVPSKKLASCAPDFVQSIRQGVIMSSQFPDRLTALNGSMIRKPATW
jgi:hypothetical protein